MKASVKLVLSTIMVWSSVLKADSELGKQPETVWSITRQIGFLSHLTKDEFIRFYELGGQPKCSNVGKLTMCSAKKSVCSEFWPFCEPNADYKDSNLVGVSFDYEYGAINGEVLKSTLDRKYGYTVPDIKQNKMLGMVNISAKWPVNESITITLFRTKGTSLSGTPFDNISLMVSDKESDNFGNGPKDTSNPKLESGSNPSLSSSPVELTAEEIEVPVSQNTASEHDPSKLIERMIEYGIENGGLAHDLEIQQLKVKLEMLPKPGKGNKKEARALNAKGLDAFRGNDFDNAVRLFEAGHILDVSDVELTGNLGYAYLKKGNLDLAQKILAQSLVMAPSRASSWQNLGDVFAKNGDLNKSVACYSHVYRFSSNKLKTHQSMKNFNEQEDIQVVKHARGIAIDWAESNFFRTN